MQQPSYKEASRRRFLSRKLVSEVMAWLTAVLLFILPNALQAQDTSKTLPNGTDGLVFKKSQADSVFVNTETDLAPNEFRGTFSTMKVGLGYIGDFTTYS